MKRALITVAATLLLTSPAWAQPYGMGPGMMGGYGSGGYDMGPGMMGGFGPGGGGVGPGCNMGPGMMGGYGPGYGMGPGMMRGYGPRGYGIPDLTSEQRAKLADIQDEYGQKQWKLMESMHGLMWNRGGASRDGKYDEKAAREAYDAMSAIRKQVFENSLEMRKRMDAVLTEKQRQQQGRG